MLVILTNYLIEARKNSKILSPPPLPHHPSHSFAPKIVSQAASVREREREKINVPKLTKQKSMLKK